MAEKHKLQIELGVLTDTYLELQRNFDKKEGKIDAMAQSIKSARLFSKS